VVEGKDIADKGKDNAVEGKDIADEDKGIADANITLILCTSVRDSSNAARKNTKLC